MELSERLRAQRERMELSQEDVAKRIFVSRQTMSSWETGKTYPDVQSLLLLGNLFGVSLDELVRGDVSTMRDMVSKDAIRWQRYAWMMMLLIVAGIAIFVILCAVLHAPFLDTWLPVGFVVGLPILAVFIVLSCVCGRRMDAITQKHDVVAFREIMAFLNGDEVDGAVPIDERAFSRAHPKLRNVLEALAGAVTGFAIMAIVEGVIALIRVSA